MGLRAACSAAVLFLVVLAWQAGAPAALTAPADPSNDARVVIDLTDVPAADAARLGAALPEMEEAINAGTERLTVSRASLGALQALGFPVRSVADALALPDDWPACYATLAEIEAWAAAFEAEHADFVEVTDIGNSYCSRPGGCTTPGGERLRGRDLLVMRVTREDASSPKEGRLWIDAGMHARELPTFEVVRSFAERLVGGYGEDPQITYLLDHRELYVGLHMNPDGREIVELGAVRANGGDPWYWRKNGNGSRGGACAWPPTPTEHFGVDLNRNHIFHWDAPGHSTNPCEQTYHGTSPGSEPETQAYEAFLRTIFPDQRGPSDFEAAPATAMGMMINFHNATAPGRMLVPWGWTQSAAPNDAGLRAIAERYIAGSGYRWQYALYPVSGEARDWAYGELGIPAYVIELEGAHFFTPCASLPALLGSQMAPLGMSLAIADRPYERIAGPEVVDLAAAASVTAGEPLTVTARLDEARAGRNPVGAAELMVGRAGGIAEQTVPGPGTAPGTGLPMAPVDGRLDAIQESVAAVLDTTGLESGRHYLAVRGRDAGGRWGPVRAVALEVIAPRPRLAVAAAAPAQVTAGDALTTTFTVTLTRAPASAVILEADLPEAVSFRRASGGASLEGGRVRWALGDLAQGAVVTSTLVVDVALEPAPRTIESGPYVVRHVDGGEAVGAPVTTHVIPPPDVRVAKAGPANARAGEALTYTLTVSVERADARGVVVTDSLPVGVAFEDASPGGRLDGTTAVWPLGDVAAGTRLTLTLRVRLVPAARERTVTNGDYGVRHARGPGAAGGPVETRVEATDRVYVPWAWRFIDP